MNDTKEKEKKKHLILENEFCMQSFSMYLNAVALIKNATHITCVRWTPRLFDRNIYIYIFYLLDSKASKLFRLSRPLSSCVFVYFYYYFRSLEVHKAKKCTLHNEVHVKEVTNTYILVIFHKKISKPQRKKEEHIANKTKRIVGWEKSILRSRERAKSALPNYHNSTKKHM